MHDTDVFDETEYGGKQWSDPEPTLRISAHMHPNDAINLGITSNICQPSDTMTYAATTDTDFHSHLANTERGNITSFYHKQ